jgi:hypothetical protein
METQIDELDAIVTHQETERKAYNNKQACTLQTTSRTDAGMYP